MTPEALAEALCAAMPHPGGGSRLDYEDALEAATRALAAVGEPEYEYGVFNTSGQLLYKSYSLEAAHRDIAAEKWSVDTSPVRIISRRVTAGPWEEVDE